MKSNYENNALVTRRVFVGAAMCGSALAISPIAAVASTPLEVAEKPESAGFGRGAIGTISMAGPAPSDLYYFL